MNTESRISFGNDLLFFKIYFPKVCFVTEELSNQPPNPPTLASNKPKNGGLGNKGLD